VSSPETTWGAGEYPLMGRQLEPAAVAAVDAAAVLPGECVVDVATGTGNAALVAAGRSGQVIGVDFEPALLRLAEQRARDAGRDVRWLLGDLAALPVPDDSADVVLSVFGVMYATDQPAAARELARVATRDQHRGGEHHRAEAAPLEKRSDDGQDHRDAGHRDTQHGGLGVDRSVNQTPR